MRRYCDTSVPRLASGQLGLLPSTELARLAATAQALADPIRVQMVHLLEQQPNLCTCEFSELLELAQSKTSYHLRILVEAGIASRETHGTWSHYSLLDRDLLSRLRLLAAQGVGIR